MILEYYFIQEFQWKDMWKSQNGISKPIIRASNQVLKNQYVDYSILEGIILHSKKLNNYNLGFGYVKELKSNLKKNGISCIYNEVAELEIRKEFSRPIDNLGSIDGIGAPLSWNIATPECLQYIPTIEIFQLLDDWVRFLKVIADSPPRIS